MKKKKKKMLRKFNSPSHDQLLNLRLPDEQYEDDEALQAVEEVADVEDVSAFEDPRDGLHAPGRAHHDKQPKVQEESVK